jgi:hypothetical protein
MRLFRSYDSDHKFDRLNQIIFWVIFNLYIYIYIYIILSSNNSIFFLRLVFFSSILSLCYLVIRIHNFFLFSNYGVILVSGI